MTPFQIAISAAWSVGLFAMGLWLGDRMRRPVPLILPDPPSRHSYIDGFNDGVRVGVSRGLRLATAKVTHIADAAEKAVRDRRERFSPCGADVAPAERAR